MPELLTWVGRCRRCKVRYESPPVPAGTSWSPYCGYECQEADRIDRIRIVSVKVGGIELLNTDD